MASTVEQIKAKLSITEVVGAYLKLEKSGGNFRACCPFHSEKTPSFFVSPSRQSYHCFGCNRGGDMFSFVEEMEGVDFLGALKILADKAGVEITYQNETDKKSYDRLYLILEAATTFYQQQLLKEPSALDYLRDRGLSDASRDRFRLGFAPAGWRNLHDYLLQQKFTVAEMLEAGLVAEGERTSGTLGKVYYDRFRSRIMFPLADPAGRIVAFSGRIFGDQTKEVAKYINSPQTVLFDKSRLLFGYDKAKMAIRRHDGVILVEGQMDLVLSHQAGVEQAVAGSGTALTPEHLLLLSRLTKNLVMAYDYDLAGLKASRRAIDLAQAVDFTVKIAKLPTGQDPADVIKRDPNEWQQAVTEAKHHIDFLIDALIHEGLKGLDLSRAVAEQVLPAVKRLAKRMEQAHFVSKISHLLGISDESVWADLAEIKIDQISPAVTKAADLSSNQSRLEMILDKLFGFLFWQEGQNDRPPELANLEDRLKEIISPETYHLARLKREDHDGRLAVEAEFFYGDSQVFVETANEMLLNLKAEVLRQELKQALAELKQAESRKDQAELDISLKKCQAITQELNKLKK